MDVDLNACISGDKLAWDAFVDRWSGVIYAAVRRTLRGRAVDLDRSELEDTVQEVFVRLIRHEYRLLRSFDSRRASLPTWLSLIARSVAIDRLRKRRVSTVPLGSTNPPAASPGPSREMDPIPLHLLSPRQRLVLRMLFDENMTVAEAAEVIGVDAQTVRSTKHKALSRLREHLAPG